MPLLPRSVTAPVVLALGAMLALSGCATRPPAGEPEALAEYKETNDPLEPTNRALFFVHEGIDTLVLRPAAEAYRLFLPPVVRTGIRNALANARTPGILLNDLLQGETYRAATTMGRFLVNTTVGLGGLMDVATSRGLPAHTEDFGQTLAVWGLGEGPYLFIPVLGPSNPRDLTGFGVDIASQPLTWVEGNEWVDGALVGAAVLNVLDVREGLIETIDDVRRTSLDPYATLRSAYRQRRMNEIGNRGDRPAAGPSGTGFGTAPRPEQPEQAPPAR
jgi:phospholipid-binding lipoprotein MlaA